MQPDPKAAEDFATLVLVTARTLRKLITKPLNPKTRAAMLTELNGALQPFDWDDLEAHEAGGCAPPVYAQRPHPAPPLDLRDDDCELPKPPRLER